MKTNNYIFLTAAVLLTVACSGDESVATQEAEGEAIAFTVSTGRAGSTRAFTTFDNYWTEDDEMAVCEGTTVYKYKAYENSTSSGGRVNIVPNSNTYGSAFFWTPEEDARTFCAWYPYEATMPTSYSVVEDQSSLSDTAYNNLDKLYAPGQTVNYQAGRYSKETVDLTFYHQMCRIVVTVNSAATSKSKPVNWIKLGDGNVAISRSVTPGETPTWGNITEKNKTVDMRPQSADDTEHLYTYECVVPPQSFGDSDVLFQIHTHYATDTSKDKTTNFIPKNMYVDAPNFEAGYQYNYSVTLSASGMVTISTLQVYDWSTENVTGLTATVPDASY